MFVGCELVTPMAPEIALRSGDPRAMALGLCGVAVCMALYGAALSQVENVVIDAASGTRLLETPMAIPAFAGRAGHRFTGWASARCWRARRPSTR